MQFDVRGAALKIAAALNDPERSLIGDPRRRVYKISLISGEMREAMQLARYLARLGIVPSTTITHDEFGAPVLAHVNVYSPTGQEAVLSIVKRELTSDRHRALEDLVLARGPIPDELLERIAKADRLGKRPQKIADRLNTEGVIAGMGGVRWTAKKVRDALVEYKKRREQDQEAA